MKSNERITSFMLIISESDHRQLLVLKEALDEEIRKRTQVEIKRKKNLMR